MNNYIEKLEFKNILNSISISCTFFLSKKLALNISPSKDLDEINSMQTLTNDAKKVIEQGDNFSFSAINESDIFTKEVLDNEVLNINDIYQLNIFLKECKKIKNLFKGLKKSSSLIKYVDEIHELNDLIEIIDLSINDNIEIKSSASQKLKKLRKKSLNTYESLNKELNKMLKNKNYSNYFQSDSIRYISGRLALELKSEYKNKFKGILHGSSSSYSTSYIEPLSTIDICNQWNDYQNQIREEEVKILKEISNSIFDLQNSIKQNIDTSTNIDLIFAKAKYSKSINGSINLKEKGENMLKLINCRHPLLGNNAVPIDVEIKNKETSIIISGPNAGGKTVALKTIGIISLMSQSGILLPCSPDSKIPVFKNYYVHIGDDQDIDKSESSFSSHISNIIFTLDTCKKDSIILIDEIVSSTDPDEGLALACAIIDYLNNKKCKTIITTHIKGLVEYGSRKDWCKNYSVNFDLTNNIPTYKLNEGIESNSFAIETSKNLGLPEEIISNAKKNLSDDYLKYKSLINELNVQRKELDKIRIDLNKKESLFIKKENALQEKIKILDLDKQEILDKYLFEQKKELEKFKKEIKTIKQSVKTSSGIKEAKKKIKKIETNFKFNETNLQDYEYKVGDFMQIEDISKIAKLIQIKLKTKGLFQIGSSIIELPLSKVISVVENYNDKGVSSFKTDMDTSNYELDLRGFSVIEVKDILEKFLDNSLLNNEKSCQIYHGIGSRSIENEVHRILKGTKFVAKFTTHNERKGVTVVSFK